MILPMHSAMYICAAQYIASYVMKHSKGRSYMKNAILSKMQQFSFVLLQMLSTFISLNLAT